MTLDIAIFDSMCHFKEIQMCASSGVFQANIVGKLFLSFLSRNLFHLGHKHIKKGQIEVLSWDFPLVFPQIFPYCVLFYFYVLCFIKMKH